jgi:hypothetical protein
LAASRTKEAAVSVNGRMTNAKIITSVVRAAKFCPFGMTLSSRR